LACSSFLLAQPSPPELYPLSLHDALPIYLGQGGDVFAVERGLGKTALPEPELALAREEAVAEQRFRLLEATPLRVVPRVLDEHVLDVVRVTDQENRARSNMVVDDVAIRLPGPHEAASCVLAHVAQVADQRATRRAGWNEPAGGANQRRCHLTPRSRRDASSAISAMQRI